jgi:hypothetical protein
MCRIVVACHRSTLTYAYGYTGIGVDAGNPKFEIAAAFPQLKEWYGSLAGPIYSLPYSFFGLVAGKLSD